MRSTKVPATTTRLTVDVWADVPCPWCYLGEHRLDTAVAASPHAAHIDLRVRSFQLDPHAPAGPVATLEYLAGRYGLDRARARAMEEDMARQAAAEGLPYAVDRPIGNTLDQLRLVQLGAAHGIGWKYLQAIRAELFGGNPDAFGHPTLVRLGESLGIPGEQVREVLAGDRYADQVRADQDRAARLGVRGVPFTVLGGRLGVPGAASVRQYTDAINQAWEQING